MGLELGGLDELAVGVRAAGDVAQDVLGGSDGEELGEGGAGDGRQEEVAAGLRGEEGGNGEREVSERGEDCGWRRRAAF